MSIAMERDNEVENGKPRSALHGLAVVVKDNIDTADSMLTTAGSLAMVASSRPVTHRSSVGSETLGWSLSERRTSANGPTSGHRAASVVGAAVVVSPEILGNPRGAREGHLRARGRLLPPESRRSRWVPRPTGRSSALRAIAASSA